MSETDKAPDPTVPKRRVWPFVVVALVAAGVTAGLAVLISNMGDRKNEGNASTYNRVVELNDTTYDPAVWGKNYPKQYDMYLQTAQITPNAHVKAWAPATEASRTTTLASDPTGPPVFFPDTRAEVTPSKLVEDPRLKTLWAGYAFSKDYRHLRGHEWMLTDQEDTLRVLALRDSEKAQPGACANCHTSLPQTLDELGNGDQAAGWETMNKTPYTDLMDSGAFHGPIACIDCHDPATMQLRITRPALIEGLKQLKASQGIADYDVNKDATNQEMRSYVCAQCHVEYYFKPPNKTLTFPWASSGATSNADGLDINNAWQYYQDVQITAADGTTSTGFTDFVNAQSGAKVLKAQHPEFETWSQGVHAQNGVTCADCHMNYVRDGAQKVSNHHVASPMADPNASCGVCHPGSTANLQARVTTIQTRFVDSRNRTLDATVALIGDIKAATDNGADPNLIALAQQYQNFANFYVDYAYSENSYGFHAPDYSQRILLQSLDAARNGQLVLLGVPADQLVPIDGLNKFATAPATEG